MLTCARSLIIIQLVRLYIYTVLENSAQCSKTKKKNRVIPYRSNLPKRELVERDVLLF